MPKYNGRIGEVTSVYLRNLHTVKFDSGEKIQLRRKNLKVSDLTKSEIQSIPELDPAPQRPFTRQYDSPPTRPEKGSAKPERGTGTPGGFTSHRPQPTKAATRGYRGVSAYPWVGTGTSIRRR